MKTIIFASVFALSSISLAAAHCPSSSETIKLCVSAPQSNDQAIAAETFDSIAICSQAPETLLVLEKGGDIETTSAKVDARVGATTYTVESKDNDYSLSLPVTGHAIQQARFTVLFKEANLSASSTYECK